MLRDTAYLPGVYRTKDGFRGRWSECVVRKRRSPLSRPAICQWRAELGRISASSTDPGA
jgi:hypothetical protein